MHAPTPIMITRHSFMDVPFVFLRCVFVFLFGLLSLGLAFLGLGGCWCGGCGFFGRARFLLKMGGHVHVKYEDRQHS